MSNRPIFSSFLKILKDIEEEERKTTQTATMPSGIPTQEKEAREERRRVKPQ